MKSPDVIVVGAGFGGLGAALALTEAGLAVELIERIGYPGGCGGTFARGGHRFQAGATMTGGLGDGQLFGQVVRRHGLPLTLTPLAPVLELRWGAAPLQIRDRAGLLADLCALPGAPVAALTAAFDEQRRYADLLWGLFDEPDLLPPYGVSSALRLLPRAPSFAPLLRWVGRPLTAWLAHHGLAGFGPLRRVLDPLCRVTVQVGPDEAEAPFAFAAMDFLFRGIRHIEGDLATALTDRLAALGTGVHFDRRATALRRDGDRWTVETRRGPLSAPVVVANLAPHALRELGVRTPRIDRLAARVETGWGAAMGYLVLDRELPPSHLDLVLDPALPLIEGNHVLVSVAGRTATVSTHLTGRPGGLPDAADVARVQAAMWATLSARAPELAEATARRLPGSPRTFARFVGRPGGWVGGVPRRAGLANYRDLWPAPVLPGLWAVGDALLMGQSTLAAFIGGQRTAAAILR